MTLPDRINSEAELEDLLAQPSDEDIAAVARLEPDILILGAGGKMGPSLARRVQRAVARAGTGSRVVAVSRFSSATRVRSLEADGVPTLACDLLSGPAITGLPRFPNVLYLAGRKFGTADRNDLTWATNTVVPARVAEHFVDSRMVVFSTGNVYPLVPVSGPAPTEADAPAPVGEYAQSCLGRERVVEYVSREQGLRALMFRLNYAVDLRYGTLVDIARKVFTRRADRPDGRLLQRHLAGRRQQLRAAQPRALCLAARGAERHRRGAHLHARVGGMVRLGLRPPASIRRSRKARWRCSAIRRCAARRLGEPQVPLSQLRAVGRALGGGGRQHAEQADPLRGHRWPFLTPAG